MPYHEIPTIFYLNVIFQQGDFGLFVFGAVGWLSVCLGVLFVFIFTARDSKSVNKTVKHSTAWHLEKQNELGVFFCILYICFPKDFLWFTFVIVCLFCLPFEATVQFLQGYF